MPGSALDGEGVNRRVVLSGDLLLSIKGYRVEITMLQISSPSLSRDLCVTAVLEVKSNSFYRREHSVLDKELVSTQGGQGFRLERLLNSDWLLQHFGHNEMELDKATVVDS